SFQKPLKRTRHTYNARRRMSVRFMVEDFIMETVVRVGAVNYLNTKPLIHEFSTLAPNAELILDLPSRLAEQLAAGELDVALIPVIEYFRDDRYSIVPNIAI